MSNSWFRLYNELLNDPKMQTLPAEVFKICINCMCFANSYNPESGKIGNVSETAFALRVTEEAVSSAFHVLLQKDILITGDDIFYFKNWKKRQFKDEESNNEYYVYFISDESLTEVKIGYSKNPWARLSNLRSGSSKVLKIVAAIRTTGSGDRWLADYFGSNKLVGEWFKPNDKMISLINGLRNKNIKPNKKSVANWLDNYVATTTDTDTEQKEENNKGLFSLAADEKSSSATPPKKNNITFSFEEKTFIGFEYLLAAWAEAYPAVDIKREMAAAAVWLVANPANRKSNYARFLTNWFQKAQDRAGRAPASTKYTPNADKEKRDAEEMRAFVDELNGRASA